MKKIVFFILKIVIFTALIGGAVLSVNALYKYYHTSEGTKFHSVPDRIEICNFGSSHGLYGFNYEELSKEHTCFNFALNSQTLSYDLRILETYQDKIAPGATVLIVVSYSSFYGLPDAPERGDLEKVNMRYYEFLPPSKIKNYDFYLDVMGYRFKALSAGIPDVAGTLIKGFKGELPEPPRSDKIWLQKATDINIASNAATTAKRHIITDMRHENGTLMLNTEELDAFYEIIRILKERNANPVLITTPFLREYHREIRKLDGTFKDQFANLMKMVCREAGVKHYNYAEDPFFMDRPDLFLNVDHLNIAGARLFTEKVAKEVLGIQLGK